LVVKVPRKLGLLEDWTVVPGIATIILGTITSVYDFAVLQSRGFRWTPLTVAGVLFIAAALTLRTISRAALNRAGFKQLGSTRLQIVEGQRLITDGVYAYVRHPLYLGDLLRNYGIAMVTSSMYGLLFMLAANLLLMARIRMEEEMLLGAFGDEYRDYVKRTRRLIPFVY
jgi:protein-S-isoprenylcysteine O-methyltransferase Ste14